MAAPGPAPEGLQNLDFRFSLRRSQNDASHTLHISTDAYENVFQRESDRAEEPDDEEALKWAALEKLPTYDRVRTTILSQMKGSRVYQEQVDVRNLGDAHRKDLINRMFAVNKTEEDNELFLLKLQKRLERAGLRLPNVEVRYENITVVAKAHVADRSLPTLTNAGRNMIEGFVETLGLSFAKKRTLTILKDVSGIIKPGRMTLLLGPPGSGKTTLLLSLAGKLSKSLKVDGKVTYNGYGLDEFVPERTSAYISQTDLHVAEMTVRETLDFSARCQGVGDRYNLVTELARREKEQGILPESDVDLFLKGTALDDSSTALVTDYTMKILGLDICSDTIVGDDMIRGISGGQKKRVTTGEMTVGPSRTLFMDEISTGLDSSTTFQIIKCMGDVARILSSTVLISLLQPAPETYNLFDDIILLSEGQVVYNGPRENVLEFFEGCGFKCPQRKGIADFLQEVTSEKDQAQYWADRNTPYRHTTVPEFVEAFKRFPAGKATANELAVPFDKKDNHPAALAFQKYSQPRWELFWANFEKEKLLMRRNSFIYIFKACQISIVAFICMTVFLRTERHRNNLGDAQLYGSALFFGVINIMFNGFAELSMTIARLPVFFKQRDVLFFPAWTFALTKMIQSIPISILESIIWIGLTYYTIGFAPAPGRFFRQLLLFFCIHQMAGGMFRFIAGLCRTTIIANTGGTLALLIIFALGGFLIPRTSIKPWWIWGYWISPLTYAQNAINVNEFLAPQWGDLGRQYLHNSGSFARGYWFWLAIGAMIGYNILFNVGFTLAITYLNPLGGPQATVEDDEIEKISNVAAEQQVEMQESVRPSPSRSPSRSPTNLHGAGKKSGRKSLRKNELRKPSLGARNSSLRNGSGSNSFFVDEMGISKKGMVLPFKPLAISFDDINYYVDLPAEMKKQGVEGDRLQLLNNITGTFRPSVLTALVGISGAGKSTLMDVLAGRKTGGYIEGDIRISGFPKQQDTFARIAGYCEQTDVHSPQVTVHESLLYSAWLRLSSDVDMETRTLFVEEVMELVELNVIRNALVGLPGVSGLSTEQRKRLTIAVELVANPSIIFMDEPTSGLDARAAAIVMRCVRNTVDTGRTVVCTIHQPSIDIFEAFDELLLMKRGGQVIYAGPLGRHSHKLIEYFEAVDGVPKIPEEYNPATWMLEVSSVGIENRLGVDFADIYEKSPLYQQNKALVKEFSVPTADAKDLWYPTKFSQPFLTQVKACLWKQNLTYWRSPDYNNVRYIFTIAAAVLFGTIFWQLGKKRNKESNIYSIMGAMYGAVLFIGFNNANTVQPVVATERTVFYREKAAGMYSPIPYAIGQVLVEIPYCFVQVLVYSVITYALIGLEWTAAKFFWYTFFMFFTFLYFSYYGMMAVSATPNHQVASITSSSLYVVFNLFSGFLISRRSIPPWWIWYYWICPVAWTIYGLIVSQFGDLNSPLTRNDDSSTTIKEFVDASFGFKHSFLPVVAAVVVVLPVMFASVFILCLKYLNFQRR